MDFFIRPSQLPILPILYFVVVLLACWQHCVKVFGCLCISYIHFSNLFGWSAPLTCRNKDSLPKQDLFAVIYKFLWLR